MLDLGAFPRGFEAEGDFFAALLAHAKSGQKIRIAHIQSGDGRCLAEFRNELLKFDLLSFEFYGIEKNPELIQQAMQSYPGIHWIHGEFLKQAFLPEFFHFIFLDCRYETPDSLHLNLVKTYSLLKMEGYFLLKWFDLEKNEEWLPYQLDEGLKNCEKERQIPRNKLYEMIRHSGYAMVGLSEIRHVVNLKQWESFVGESVKAGVKRLYPDHEFDWVGDVLEGLSEDAFQFHESLAFSQKGLEREPLLH